jgi:hypothetical protein
MRFGALVTDADALDSLNRQDGVHSHQRDDHWRLERADNPSGDVLVDLMASSAAARNPAAAQSA